MSPLLFPALQIYIPSCVCALFFIQFLGACTLNDIIMVCEYLFGGEGGGERQNFFLPTVRKWQRTLAL